MSLFIIYLDVDSSQDNSYAAKFRCESDEQNSRFRLYTKNMAENRKVQKFKSSRLTWQSMSYVYNQDYLDERMWGSTKPRKSLS